MKRKIIDLRSDTVTQPTAEMRRAMAEAKVGDDVYGEDPTVNALQEQSAEVFQREAALFVPSGTMANQIAIRIYVRPGQEVICEERSHIISSELGMVAAFAGALVRPIWAQDGILTWRLIEPYLHRVGMKYGSTGLIALENTANFAGGTIYPLENTREICEKAHAASLPVFLDGARIFNAAVALGVPVSAVSQGCDSVMFSLSKGLGSPVGSILVGDATFIEEARSIRKMLGGAMRQAGVLAAAGLLALKRGPEHLAQDHHNATYLAAELANISSLDIDPTKVSTNIVLLETRKSGLSAADLVARLASEQVLANAIGANTVRLVTHRDVTRDDCEHAIQIIRSILHSSTNAVVQH